jgi:dihydroneopterin triphosphate diphosphatase
MNIKASLIEAHVIRKVGKDIEFLLLKRAQSEIYPGLWQMVTGSVDGENERGFETALREIKEETNLNPQKFWVVPNVNSFYWPEQDALYLIPVFVALVESCSVVKISEEHSDYKWVDKNNAIKLLAWPGQRKSVEIIHNYFINEQSFLNFVEIPLNEKKI